ncbi:phenylalanine--tRNA ligase subunit beta, partial [Candidatus Pacearchaeota archaeon]|nr:phenylalanine--tRNA ligase subunit beta [Candidatus Pacearchaeota archaeon]
DYTILRENLAHYLLKNFAENIDSEYPQKIFEIGKVFNLNGEIVEEENLGVAITPGNFTKIKQILEYLSRMLNIEIQVKEPERFPAYLIEGRVAEIFIEDKKIGFIGEIHPRILKNWRIKMPLALFEISLEKIFEKLN